MQHATAVETHPDWASILAVTLGISAFGLSLGLSYPLISLILIDRGYGEGIVGLNAGTYGLGIAASTAFMPWMTTRFRADHLVVVGLAISAAAIAGFALFPALGAWFVLRFILGWSINVVCVLGEAWLNAACTESLRGRVTAAYMGATTTGFALGPLGVPLLGMDDSFGFAVGAAVVALVTVGFAVLVRRTRVRPAAAPPGSLYRFLHAAPLLIAMVATFAIVDAAAIALLPIYFVREGLNAGLAATTVTVLLLGVLGTTPVIGVALDRYDRTLVALVCALVGAMMALMLPFIDVANPSIWFVIFLLGGAFSAMYTCALTGLGEGFKGGMLVAGSAIFALVYGVGGVIGPPMAGILMEESGRSETVPFMFGITLLLLTGALGWAKIRGRG